MAVISPVSVLLPPPEQEIHVIRGDVFRIALGFTGREDVAANLSAHRVRMVFRRRQSDTLPDILSALAVLEAPDSGYHGDDRLDVIAEIQLTPAQTQVLPAGGCVYFIEWTDAAGGSNGRIVQGRVVVGD